MNCSSRWIFPLFGKLLLLREQVSSSLLKNDRVLNPETLPSSAFTSSLLLFVWFLQSSALMLSHGSLSAGELPVKISVLDPSSPSNFTDLKRATWEFRQWNTEVLNASKTEKDIQVYRPVYILLWLATNSEESKKIILKLMWSSAAVANLNQDAFLHTTAVKLLQPLFCKQCVFSCCWDCSIWKSQEISF